jgi:hypothetical protein
MVFGLQRCATMHEILSKSAYAAARGVKADTVRSWIHRGHLTAPALRDDGRINVKTADAQLRDRLDALKGADLAGPDRSPAPRACPAPAGDLLGRLRQQRLAEGEMRLRRLRDEEDLRRGNLVHADAAASAWSAGLQGLLGALDTWLTIDLPERLGLGVAGALRIREEWRMWRTKMSANFVEAAPPERVPRPEDKP